MCASARYQTSFLVCFSWGPNLIFCVLQLGTKPQVWCDSAGDQTPFLACFSWGPNFIHPLSLDALPMSYWGSFAANKMFAVRDQTWDTVVKILTVEPAQQLAAWCATFTFLICRSQHFPKLSHLFIVYNILATIKSVIKTTPLRSLWSLSFFYVFCSFLSDTNYF